VPVIHKVTEKKKEKKGMSTNLHNLWTQYTELVQSSTIFLSVIGKKTNLIILISLLYFDTDADIENDE
jgi:hypothetical protein